MGINNNINITQLSPKIQEILNKNTATITKNVKVLAKEVTNELTKNTKRDSPKDTGEYKKHITSKKTKETSTSAVYTWYVKDPEYRLTHLISKEHRIVVGSGPKNKIPLEVGKTKGNDFLSKNVIEAQNKFIKGVRRIIENAN